MKLLSPKDTLLRWGSEESVKCSTSVKQSAPMYSVSSEGRLFRERALKKWNDPSRMLSVFSATQFSMCSSPFFLVKLSSLNTMLSKLFRLRIRTVRMEPRENEPTERRLSLRNAPRSNTVLSMSLHSPSGITNSLISSTIQALLQHLERLFGLSRNRIYGECKHENQTNSHKQKSRNRNAQRSSSKAALLLAHILAPAGNHRFLHGVDDNGGSRVHRGLVLLTDS